MEAAEMRFLRAVEDKGVDHIGNQAITEIQNIFDIICKIDDYQIN
jgi:hypothetical protein